MLPCQCYALVRFLLLSVVCHELVAVDDSNIRFEQGNELWIGFQIFVAFNER